jgi:hypothetical protein
MAAEGNWRREHGKVVDGTDGEIDEHRGMKAEHGNATSSLGGERRRAGSYRVLVIESGRAE